MSIIIDDSTSLHIGVELGLALGVESLIEVCLTLIKLVLAQRDGPASHKGILCFTRRSPCSVQMLDSLDSMM